MSYDPRFPNRPQHPNFQELAACAIANDNLADKGLSVEDVLILAGIDPSSIIYLAQQRATRIPLGGDEEQVHGSIAAGWIDGFLAGRRYAQNKAKTEVTTVLDDSIDGNRRQGH